MDGCFGKFLQLLKSLEHFNSPGIFETLDFPEELRSAASLSMCRSSTEKRRRLIAETIQPPRSHEKII